ncbi:penicillin-binding protein 2 [Litorimonas sp. RW-G-Af-16]|uniref:penicillin-binding protein 2 n=1 Tax=Litorimonas sp. RW-G-Af-16 TaxID=3241168 RepID=UPI00390CABCA
MNAESGKSDGTIINRRAAMMGLGGVGIFGVLASRLFYLQVEKAEDYLTLSENNRFNFNVILPVRGKILDRYGEKLAENRQDFRAVLIPERTKDIDQTLARVSDIVGLDEAAIKRIKKDIRENAKFIPIMIKDHLDWKTFSTLNMKMHNLPGIIPEAGEGRSYPNGGVFAHTLGYVGRANDKDMEVDRDPLLRQPTFRIGKTGVEAAAESTLRGSAGRLKVEVNAMGRIVREWPDPKDRATPGKDVWLTLDAPLQRFAAEQFGEDSGGLAVMDVMTGELRTLLSMPSYDANLFVSGLTQADMDALNNDERRPQYNKVISGGYAPASTFKMVVMLAALESKMIDPSRDVFCVGRLRLGNRTFHCWKRQGHGRMDMHDALKHSCDAYFYEIAQVIGIERIADMARRLGLGQRHDVGIAGEKSGIVPDPTWKQDKLGSAWRMGDTLNASIGQGFVLATPLQLAVMTARIANAKYAVSPTLIVGQDLREPLELNINPRHLAYVQRSMWAVVNEEGGTGVASRNIGLPDIEIAAKTGTAQVRGISASERASGVRKNEALPWKLRDHSIFVAYGPYAQPRFAVGCVVEHGGSGSRRAAQLARTVLAEALKRDGLGPRTENSEPSKNKPVRL